MVGAPDIINEKGLALPFNQLGFGKGSGSEPVFIMLRRIAETCSSLDAARKQIRDPQWANYPRRFYRVRAQ